MTTADKPDNKDDGFLGRWSRRKLKPEANPEPEVPAVPTVAAAPAEPDTRPRDPETGELIDEDLVASLPKVSELQAGGDLSAFMQKGVPEALRREALRTMWLNDPMIRNYVSPALDYAYDYNVPGGAPGYGPLTESDMANAREFLANVFSTPQKTADESVSAEEIGNSDNESQSAKEVLPEAVRQSNAALQKPEKDDVTANSSNAHGKPAADTILPQVGEVAIVQCNILGPDNTEPVVPRRRRGGSAAPL